MIDLILESNGLEVRVRCVPSEGAMVNTAGKVLDLTTRLMEELWAYDTVDISIKTPKQEDPMTVVTQPMDELFKVHEDNMMRVYNEQRTTS